jgi:signal peptidase I
MCMVKVMNADCLILSGEKLRDLMFAVLENNADFRFRAKGHSMSPFIRNQDIVTISPLSRHGAGFGDIVAVSLPNRASIMIHRIIGNQKGKFKIKGDNLKISDGFFNKDSILGRVSKVERIGGNVWYGGGNSGKIIAFFSKTGLLNYCILPGLRIVKVMATNLFL